MTVLLERHQEAIRALCREYNVARLEVFGSATRDDFDPTSSDIDFLVEFLPHPQLTRFEQYFNLEEALSALLGRKVDLVMEKAMKNPYFIRSVNQSRQLLYAA